MSGISQDVTVNLIYYYKQLDPQHYTAFHKHRHHHVLCLSRVFRSKGMTEHAVQGVSSPHSSSPSSTHLSPGRKSPGSEMGSILHTGSTTGSRPAGLMTSLSSSSEASFKEQETSGCSQGHQLQRRRPGFWSSFILAPWLMKYC